MAGLAWHWGVAGEIALVTRREQAGSKIVGSKHVRSMLAFVALSVASGAVGCALDTTGAMIPGGGPAAGGRGTGGAETGGAETGGDAGGVASQGGAETGGDDTGGAETGGIGSGGRATGGVETGGRVTVDDTASGGTAGGEPCSPEAGDCAVVGQWCQGSVCACAPDQIVCGLECVYQWDERNCGACGVTCIQPEYCQQTEGGCAPP